MRTLLTTAFIIVMLAACSIGDSAAQNVTNRNWMDGFTHGCNSGKSVTYTRWKFTKVAKRYKSQPDYKAGWDKGFKDCMLAY